MKSSEFKMNAILDFARFLSSGCFVGDLGLILGGFAVVFWVITVIVGGVKSVGGGFSRGSFVRRVFFGGFVRGVLSGGVLSSGILSGGGRGFVRGPVY